MCIRDRYDCCANCIESKMEHASLSFTTPTPSSSAIDMTFSMNIKYLLSQQFMRFIGQLSGGKYSSIREKRASSIYAFHKRNQVLLVVPIKRDATVGQHFDVIRKNDRQSRREHSVFQCTAFQLMIQESLLIDTKLSRIELLFQTLRVDLRHVYCYQKLQSRRKKQCTRFFSFPFASSSSIY
eukprot:TRINITY_DN4312_c0_g1_i5.p1 TRINITY_DN4312_c0_g1~~TRINITY_DN4312_c0_g1_i5.p1  ORF type:complete len:207 (-),score=1.23 TRINITY_DN4312_c0_g1_i5:367-912(-)